MPFYVRRHGNRIAEVGFGCGLVIFLIGLLCFAGWLTHIVVRLVHHEWIMMLAGAIAFPVGVIDGWGLWFHWWTP
jgi:hypothetical protein